MEEDNLEISLLDIDLEKGDKEEKYNNKDE